MFVSVVRFDEILHVHRNETNRTTPQHTVFSFISNFEYTPYVCVPGFPRLAAGMQVAALLREQDNWKTLVGWRDLDTGLLAAPDARFHLYRLLFLVVWLLVFGYGVASRSTPFNNVMALVAILVLACFGAFVLLELLALRRARTDCAALQTLLPSVT